MLDQFFTHTTTLERMRAGPWRKHCAVQFKMKHLMPQFC
jgi:hypothetical protein